MKATSAAAAVLLLSFVERHWSQSPHCAATGAAIAGDISALAVREGCYDQCTMTPRATHVQRLAKGVQEPREYMLAKPGLLFAGNQAIGLPLDFISVHRRRQCTRHPAVVLPATARQSVDRRVDRIRSTFDQPTATTVSQGRVLDNARHRLATTIRTTLLARPVPKSECRLRRSVLQRQPFRGLPARWQPSVSCAPSTNDRVDQAATSQRIHSHRPDRGSGPTPSYVASRSVGCADAFAIPAVRSQQTARTIPLDPKISHRANPP